MMEKQYVELILDKAALENWQVRPPLQVKHQEACFETHPTVEDFFFSPHGSGPCSFAIPLSLG